MQLRLSRQAIPLVSQGDAAFYSGAGLLTASTWFALLVLLSFAMWGGEEPSRLHTLGCLLTVSVLAIACISYAARKQVIVRSDVWLLIFGVRLLLATVVITAIWFQPDMSHRTYTINSFDPVRWDAWGEMLMLGDFPWSLGLPDTGLIYYIATIYRLFGVSCIYIAWFNCLLELITLLLVSGLLKEAFGRSRRWDWMALGMFIPELIWFDSLALREVHCSFFLALAIFGIFRIVRNHKRKFAYLIVALSYLGMILMRPKTVIIFALLLVACAFLGPRKKFKKAPMLLPLFLIMAVLFISLEPYVTNLSHGTSIVESVSLEQTISEGNLENQYEANSINFMLIPQNIFQRILFIFPRMVCLAIAPFPNFQYLWSGWTTPTLPWQAAGYTAGASTMLLFLFLGPSLVAGITNAMVRQDYRNTLWLIIPAAIYLAAVANAELTFHERWRSAIWPFWLAIVILGWPYRRRYYTLCLSMASLGLLAYYILKGGLT
jgi:hypothetical protein